MTLDVNTPRGQASVVQESRAIEIFEGAFPSMRFVRTQKETPAELDGVILKHGELFATAEVKCRECTREKLMSDYRGEWLLTYDKVRAGIEAHRMLSIGMVGLLYLIPDDVVLLVRILNDSGHVVPPMRVEATETQRTINGGTIIRNNAYLHVGSARVLEFAKQAAA